MYLAPFGELHQDYKKYLKNDLFKPMPRWIKTKSEHEYRILMENWLDDVTSNIWPAWKNGSWVGGAAAEMDTATHFELEKAVELYHGRGHSRDVLMEKPDTPTLPDNTIPNHDWHYKIEDALVHDPKFLYPHNVPECREEPSYSFRASRYPGSNYLVYDPGFGIEEFESLFWGYMQQIAPPIWDIKQQLQRPRPWSTATALGVKDFRWVVAKGNMHTGLHPSILSGHCIQGILGGCSVIDILLSRGTSIEATRMQALQQYAVDWGDRRVFAGVHYFTDNIASWTLAQRLIPTLFPNNADAVGKFAHEAITKYSRVFSDIVNNFDASSPARTMLLNDIPIAVVDS